MARDEFIDEDRRRLLAIAPACAVAALAPDAPLAANAPAPGFDAGDAEQLFRAYRLMRYAGHEQPVYWWMKGTRYGLVDDELIPFFDMHVGSIVRCRNQPGGGFTITNLEVVYYSELGTERLIETWRNPVTNRDVTMRYRALGPADVTYTVSGAQLPTSLPGVQIDARQAWGPARIVGEDIWLQEATHSTVTRPGTSSRPFRVSDLGTYRSRLADVLDPKVTFVRCDVAFNDIAGWPKALEMGDRPGTCISRCAGSKVATLGEMPSVYLEFLERLQPQVYKDPAAALGGPQQAF